MTWVVKVKMKNFNFKFKKYSINKSNKHHKKQHYILTKKHHITLPTIFLKTKQLNSTLKENNLNLAKITNNYNI